MFETDDNQQTAAAEATTATETLAEGENGSTSTGQGAASTETTDNLILGKFRNQQELVKAYENLEKLASRKGVDPAMAVEALGMSQAAPATETPATKAEGRELAQQAGGDELATWFEQASKTLGTTKAIAMLTEHITNQTVTAMLAKTLAPVNDQLSQAKAERNAHNLETAVDKLALDYPDLGNHLGDMKGFLDARPTLKQQLDQATTAKEKQELLESVYLRVSAAASKNTAAAAKAAGAVDAKRQDQMKQTAVTEGAGGGKARQGEATPEERLKAAIRAAGGSTNNRFL
jgi:uncharacterized membrane-anchored protein YhcB (DUF1043 family)